MDHGAASEFSRVSLDLIAKGIVTDSLASIGDLLDEDCNLFGVLNERENKISLDGGLLISWQIGLIEAWDLVEVG